MADLPPYHGSTGDIGSSTTPRWVKIFGIITLVVILLFVMLMVTGGHNPSTSRH